MSNTLSPSTANLSGTQKAIKQSLTNLKSAHQYRLKRVCKSNSKRKNEDERIQHSLTNHQTDIFLKLLTT